MSFLFSCQWSLDSRFPNRFFASRTSWIPDCTKQKHSGVPESRFPYLVKREKKKSHSTCDKRWTKKPFNHRNSTPSRQMYRRSLARNRWSSRLSVYRTVASTNSGGFSSWKNSGALFCWQALCCTSDTAAAAVLTEVKTFMFGASISPIVRLHWAPLANHNAAGLFRFCVATMLALPEFRSLLSGCIYNI